MYGYWSSVTWPVTDCTVRYRPVLSSERAPYRKNNKVIVNLGMGPKGSPISRRGQLTVGRKINHNHKHHHHTRHSVDSVATACTRSKGRPVCTEEQRIVGSLLAPPDSESTRYTSLGNHHCGHVTGAQRSSQQQCSHTLIKLQNGPSNGPIEAFHDWFHLLHNISPWHVA
jgi:hypothetical protein